MFIPIQKNYDQVYIQVNIRSTLELQQMLAGGYESSYNGDIYFSQINLIIQRKQKLYISPQGLHFQKDAKDYFRLDQNGLTMSQVKLKTHETNITSKDNFIRSTKDVNGMQSGIQISIGNKHRGQESCYLQTNNNQLYMKGSNFQIQNGKIEIDDIPQYFIDTQFPDPNAGIDGDI